MNIENFYAEQIPNWDRFNFPGGRVIIEGPNKKEQIGIGFFRILHQLYKGIDLDDSEELKNIAGKTGCNVRTIKETISREFLEKGLVTLTTEGKYIRSVFTYYANYSQLTFPRLLARE